jgi:hypothetical protein
MGASSVHELFDAEYYADLPGGILKNFGRLKNDLKICVYPLQHRSKDELHVVDAFDSAQGRPSIYHCDFISDVPAANSKRAAGNQ